MTAYSASKAGLIGLVKSMAKDYAETGITVNALAPAVIQHPHGGPTAAGYCRLYDSENSHAAVWAP